MTIEQLKYVLTLARTRNFTKAAQKLYITQPTLSQQIKAIENELQITLFKRNNRFVELTETGKIFVDHTQKIIQQWTLCTEDINHFSNHLQGTLKIGLLWTFGYSDIDRILESFQHDYPKIQLEYTFDGSTNLLDSLLHNDLDIAFIVDRQDQSILQHTQLQSFVISQSPIMVVLNKQHPYANKNNLTADDLENTAVFMPSKKSNIYKSIHHTIQQAGTHPIVIGYSSQADALIQAVKANLGIAFLSYETLQKFQDNTLCCIPYHPTVIRTILCVYKNKANELVELFKNNALKYCRYQN